jgi:ankyrin repeat protein
VLFDAGVSVHLIDDKHRTPLHWALMNRASPNVQIVEMLLDFGADMSSVDSWEWTPLHRAVAHINLEATTMLVEAGADVNVVTNEGLSVLDLARKWNEDPDIEDYLLTVGAESAYSSEGLSADLGEQLYGACYDENAEAALALIQDPTTDLNWQGNHKGNAANALYFACINGMYDVVQALLENGTITQACYDHEITPMMAAVNNGHTEVLNF